MAGAPAAAVSQLSLALLSSAQHSAQQQSVVLSFHCNEGVKQATEVCVRECCGRMQLPMELSAVVPSNWALNSLEINSMAYSRGCDAYSQ
jgi:hypothetical protein